MNYHTHLSKFFHEYEEELLFLIQVYFIISFKDKLTVHLRPFSYFLSWVGIACNWLATGWMTRVWFLRQGCFHHYVI